jgi:hypothetical protein
MEVKTRQAVDDLENIRIMMGDDLDLPSTTSSKQ